MKNNMKTNEQILEIIKRLALDGLKTPIQHSGTERKELLQILNLIENNEKENEQKKDEK